MIVCGETSASELCQGHSKSTSQSTHGRFSLDIANEFASAAVEMYCSLVKIILVDWRVFDNPTALVSYYFRAGAGAAFFCISYRGKLLQHKLIRVQCTKKSTRVPVSPVPSTGIRFKQVVLIKHKTRTR